MINNQARPPAQLLARPRYPSGVPLTDSMELTSRDGVRWLVYIEGVPLPRTRPWARQTGFPGRRLRFDSAAESRVVKPVPAGSPFLTDARLQDLLDRSERLDAIIAPAPATARSAGWTGRHAAALLTQVVRHWQQLAAGAADQLFVWGRQFLGGPARARL